MSAEPPALPQLWPTPEGRQARSTELHVELGSAERPALVRVTSQYLDAQTGLFRDRHGYILFTEQGVVLIDPNEPTPDVRPRFDALVGGEGPGPSATVLTSSWHERHAYLLRERFGSPVWMPRAGVSEKEGEPDELYDEGAALPGGLRAVAIDDRFAGDTVLYWTAPSGERVLFGGDAVMGGSGMPGHWRCESGVHLWMYGALEEERFLSRFRRLLDEPVDLICGGHGRPMAYRDDPMGTLQRLIDDGVFKAPVPLGNGRSLKGS